jgi:hypothetical protein
MSWATTRSQIERLLNCIGFTRAPEIFNIEKQPASFIDCVFCIQLDEMAPNSDGFGDVADRFFPTEKIRISASYDLFNASQDSYDSAIDKNMKIIQVLINPIKRPDNVRMCGYAGSKTKLFKEENNWLIIDNYFDLQVQVAFLDFASLALVIDKQLISIEGVSTPP